MAVAQLTDAWLAANTRVAENNRADAEQRATGVPLTLPGGHHVELRSAYDLPGVDGSQAVQEYGDDSDGLARDVEASGTEAAPTAVESKPPTDELQDVEDVDGPRATRGRPCATHGLPSSDCW